MTPLTHCVWCDTTIFSNKFARDATQRPSGQRNALQGLRCRHGASARLRAVTGIAAPWLRGGETGADVTSQTSSARRFDTALPQKSAEPLTASAAAGPMNSKKL